MRSTWDHLVSIGRVGTAGAVETGAVVVPVEVEAEVVVK